MNDPDPNLQLDSLSPDDADACATLGQAGGWATDAKRWRMMLGVGVGLGARTHGELVGAVIVNPFGPRLASIAMMMVHPSRRREGIAGLLMVRALERAAGATVFLTATALGRPLYARLGFIAMGIAQRLEGTSSSRDEDAHPGLRGMRDADLPGVLALDAGAFGGSRRSLLHALVAAADRACVVEREGEIVAFGLSSIVDGSRLVAPVIAREGADARAVAARMCASSEVPVKIDLPMGETALLEWACAAGLERTDVTTVMVLGGDELPGRHEWVRAMAGRAYG